jgi:hypothetical protein
VQGNHASMSSPSLTLDIFVNKRKRTHQKWTIQIHCQHWAIRVLTKLPNSEHSLKNSKQNTTQKTQSYSF